MRIAFYGNICNNLYIVCKALKKYSDIDVHLYLAGQVDIQNRPESEDPELENNYPYWIHKDNKWNPKLAISKRSRSFIRELNKYDIAILSDLGPALSPYLKAKTVFFTTGADLTRFPFPLKFLNLYKGFDKIKFLVLGYYQRRGIKNIDQIWTQPFSPFINSLKQLKIKPEKIKNAYFPIIVDTEKIKYRDDAASAIAPEILRQLSPFKFIIFHPARFMIKRDKKMIENGLTKFNDTLIYGFSKFIKENNVTDACLVMIDRKFSGDIDEAKQIINTEGIEKYCVWIKGKTDEGFTKNELVDLYSYSNVIADSFEKIGWIGSIVVEGLACSRPVIHSINDEINNALYGWHPVLNAYTPGEVNEQIKKLYLNPELQKELGSLGRKWVELFHSPENASKKYVEELKRLLD